MTTATAPMTVEEFLALPDDGTDRWLIAGELRERAMTTRNPFHSRSMTRAAQFLANWLDQQPAPRGQILTGDAGVRIEREPVTLFGVDVVYVSADVIARQPAETTMINGVPTLAVEILSPSDVLEDVNEKIDAYLAAGVPLVWVIDPHRRTVTAFCPDADPSIFGPNQDLTGEPALPGFRVPVAKLFE